VKTTLALFAFESHPSTLENIVLAYLRHGQEIDALNASVEL
jgi:hypothetical protein